MAGTDPLNRHTGTHTIRDLKLENGTVLPEAVIAYETYGHLAPDGRNAVLLTHGYTSTHRLVGAGESWDDLVGPGKPIDTDRFYVVASNMLGGCYGSTGPASTDPRTGKPYGPDFPDIGLLDIVTAQKAMLDALGVKHLVAVAGPSYGGYQAFQWAVTFPDAMDGIVAAVTAPKGPGHNRGTETLTARLATDPNWNGGRYYDRGGVPEVMTAIRVETLKRYGAEARFPESEKEAGVRRLAEPWVQRHDANTMIVLRRAADRFDAEKDFARIKAKVLYVIARTDLLFPPSLVPGVMEKLKAAGVDATYFALDSEHGHLAPSIDAAKWAPALRAFMDRLAPPGQRT